MKSFILIAGLFMTQVSMAALIKKDVSYAEGDIKLKGYVVYDDAISAARPGILVVHDWLGLTDKTKDRANMLASLGYVAFAADIYGEGVRPRNQEDAGKLATQYKTDRKTYRARLTAALGELKKQALVNGKKLGAIGYCFGGTGVIELARAGADVRGVVSFHGGLDSPTPADGKNIKSKLLALHGADDPYVKKEDLEAFEAEMRDAKVDWQLIKYGNSVHSFTDKSAGNDNKKGAAYNAKADARSWDNMRTFFAEVFSN